MFAQLRNYRREGETESIYFLDHASTGSAK